MNFCKEIKTKIIGIAVITATAIRLFHCVPNSPENLVKPIVKGQTLSFVVNVSAKTKSPQPHKKLIAPTVIKPGTTKGIIIFQKAPNLLLPSIKAASSSEFGNDRK